MWHVVTDEFNTDSDLEEIQATRFKYVSNVSVVKNLDTRETRPDVNNGTEVKIGLDWLALLKPSGID